MKDGAERRSGYDEHRLEQRRQLARETTPQQRVQWLEDTLFMLWRNGLLPSKMPDQSDAADPPDPSFER